MRFLPYILGQLYCARERLLLASPEMLAPALDALRNEGAQKIAWIRKPTLRFCRHRPASARR